MLRYFFSLPVTPQILGTRTSLRPILDAWTRLTITALILSFCVTASSTISGGAGISTCSPSPTTSVLGLGPDLPWVDQPSPGNLGPSTPMFLAWVSLLIPAFSLPCSPLVLPLQLLPACNAPLPMLTHPAASVLRFSPVTSSALNHSTSELLRTL